MNAAGEDVRDMLGAQAERHLATIPASRTETRAARITAVTMVAVAALSLAAGGISGPVLPPTIPLLMGAIIVTELLSAYLLYSQFVESREPAFAVAGCAYVVVGFSVPAYLLTFPQVFSVNGLFGANQQTAIAVWAIWHAAYPVLIGIAALTPMRASDVPAVSKMRARLTAAVTVIACALFAATATYLATKYSAFLPALVNVHVFTPLMRFGVLPVICTFDLAAIVALVRGRNQTPVQLWLPVAVLASLFDAILGVVWPRYSFGWYEGKLFGVVSSSLILIVLVTQITNLYRTLRGANRALQRMNDLERDNASRELRASEERLALAQDVARLGTWEVDLITDAVRWSPMLHAIAGIPEGNDITRHSFRQLLPDEDGRRLEHAAERARATRSPFIVEHRLLRPDGREIWIESRGQFLYDKKKQPYKLYGTALDITERKRAQEKAAFLARHDALTLLPNRGFLMETLKTNLAGALRHNRQAALVFIDLDRFKVVNDVMGHAAGDELLKSVAARLRGCVREGDIVARLGGDEFVILLADIDNENDVIGIARDVVERIGQPFDIDRRDVFTTASLGISIFPGDGETAEDLLRNADSAMYQAKESGPGTFRFFTHGVHAAALERITLENDLRFAIDKGELTLHYQPIVKLSGDRRVNSAEALLRWNHPVRGAVPPDVFIPLAEQSGLMIRIGDWVLERALAQLAAWRTSGLEVDLAVNVSMREFQDRDFFKRVTRKIEESSLNFSDLCLEITESLAMKDPFTTQETLQRFRSLGVGMALDDFGTHYSSLAYLKKFPVSSVKIDKSFTRDLPHNAADAAIVQAVISIAEHLDLSVIAEGIETEEQLRWLAAAGCPLGQGYYFARPMPAHEFETWLKREAGRP